MALQLAVNNPFNGLSEKGYIKLDTTQVDRVNKKGFIRFVIYQDKTTRNTTGKLPFDALTIWSREGEQIISGFLKQLSYVDLCDKTTEELYNKIKKYKLETDRGEALDLTVASDV